MKKPNPTIIKHALVAAFVAIALNGCDDEGDKSAVEVVEPTKQAAVSSEGTVVKPAPVAPAPVAPAPVNPVSPPVSQAPASPPPKPAIIRSNDTSGLVNIAEGKVATHSETYNGAESVRPPIAALAVDGNVDGHYYHGSTAFTKSNPNAWLDIDLGKSEDIDHIVVWNRTDDPLDRLKDYWIFVSDKPFSATDTASKLKNTKGVKAIRGGMANPSFTTATALVKGRYVRIQYDDTVTRAAAMSYLPLAEVEVYRAKLSNNK